MASRHRPLRAIVRACELASFGVGTLAAQVGDTLPVVAPRPGLVITRPVRIAPGRHVLPAPGDTARALLVVRGDDVTVDLRGVTLVGLDPAADPDEAAGTAIRIEGGRRVTILGGRIRGYRTAILALGTRDLVIRDADLRHGWRPRLFSDRWQESLVDWLSFHRNEHGEWRRFGAAIHLDGVTGGTIDGVRAEQGMNGLLAARSDSLRIVGNTFAFNSGLGIGLYRTRDLVIANNALDFNVRGYSHRVYRRGQDSAGILCFEQCSGNLFAFNVVTHGGDGFFLWAGQSTMDSGAGGSNDNRLVGNDFSFAPTNGIEATFSRNTFVGNVIEGNDHGIWGGYSYASRIEGNCVSRNRIAIAVEHGQDNLVARNRFAHDSIAIALWGDPVAPSDWGYPKHRDTRSRDWRIVDNQFVAPVQAWRLERTSGLEIDRNRHVARDTSACTPRALLGTAWDSVLASLPPGIDTVRPSRPRPDRAAIVIDAWGPYDGRSPRLVPVDTLRDTVRLALLGPVGRWTLASRTGVASLSRAEGATGDTITVIPSDVRAWRVALTWRGAAIEWPNGDTVAAGREVPVVFAHEDRLGPWRVRLVSWRDSTDDPLRDTVALARALAGDGARVATWPRLSWTWSRPRTSEVPATRWAMVAESEVVVPAGTHALRTIADDAVRVWIDGRLVIDDWVPGESRVRAAPIASGRRRVRVAYWQRDGWSELRVDLVAGSARSRGSPGPH
ncbi:MAG: right-handed parallel beta-helix repeat-containing protein [Gemmatimonadaceae bacterium]|nr:right-handed parallel beta-helix repeat-containing protein [Gemmatimonadaceae bacterium]